MARTLGLMLLGWCVAGCAFQVGDEGAATGRTLAPAAPPPVDLGPGITATAARPGRYEMAMSLQAFSSCSQSWASYGSRSTLSLQLDPGGGAGACRALESTHSDPDGSRGAAHRHAYAGRWRRDGAWVVVDLQPASDPACQELAESPHERLAPWRLRCVDVTPAADDRSLQTPALACRFDPEPVTETLGYAVRRVLDQQSAWLLLGPSPGVAVSVQEQDWGDSTVTVRRL